MGRRGFKGYKQEQEKKSKAKLKTPDQQGPVESMAKAPAAASLPVKKTPKTPQVNVSPAAGAAEQTPNIAEAPLASMEIPSTDDPWNITFEYPSSASPLPTWAAEQTPESRQPALALAAAHSASDLSSTSLESSFVEVHSLASAVEEAPPSKPAPTAKVQEALALPECYMQRKTEQGGFLSFFSTLSQLVYSPSQSDRLEEINFITLIATHLGKESNAAQLIDGAYLYVTHDIKVSYDKAWWSKNPTASQLYLELTARTADMRDSHKIDCLNRLSTCLQNEDTQKKLEIDAFKTGAILKQIDAQLQELTEATSSASYHPTNS